VNYNYVVSAQGRGNYLQLQNAIDAAPSKTAIYVLDGNWEVSNRQLKAKKLKLVIFPGTKVQRRN
jgi:pectinesterase